MSAHSAGARFAAGYMAQLHREAKEDAAGAGSAAQPTSPGEEGSGASVSVTKIMCH